MSTQVKLAAFAATLGLLAGGGALTGAAIGPDRDGARAEGGVGHTENAGDTMSAATHRESTSGAHGAKDPVRGLAVAENGLRLVVDDPELRRGRAETLRFRIVDDAGETVRDFDVEHTKRMHLIVARRDLTGFQHLHPEQAADGSWSTSLRLADAGSYRVFADFSHGDDATTLAGDLRVDGSANLRALPAPARTAVSDGGYDVRLDGGAARPGKEAELRFTVTKDGRPVHTQPYLGAGGHLVALREDDLAFLHVHPIEGSHADTQRAPDAAEQEEAIGFAATFPTTGRYRLFLQFQVAGQVQTVAFTQEVR